MEDELEDSGKEEELQLPEGKRKPYKSNFASVKEETELCPYKACGRKFTSIAMLK